MLSEPPWPFPRPPRGSPLRSCTVAVEVAAVGGGGSSSSSSGRAGSSGGGGGKDDGVVN